MEREVVLQVRKAIDRLPVNFKAALVLCEYEQMPYAQIAENIGCEHSAGEDLDFPCPSTTGGNAQRICGSAVGLIDNKQVTYADF